MVEPDPPAESAPRPGAWRRLPTIARWLLVVPLSLFCLWMALFAMPLSAVTGLLGTVAIAPIWRSRVRVARLVFLLVVAPGLAWNVGIHEYSRESWRLSCIAWAASGAQAPGRCAQIGLPPRLDVPASERALLTGPVFTRRERLEVRGLNVVMAVGGWFVGFREVAWETLVLDEPREDAAELRAQTFAARRGLCSQATVEPRATHRRRSSFAMRSPRVRATVASLARQAEGLAVGQEMQLTGKTVRWSTGQGGNNDVYTHLLKTDSVRVAFALLVPGAPIGGTASASRRRTRLDLEWTGTISYPPNAFFEHPVPTLAGPVSVLLDEGVFCGLQMDGVFSPYEVTWHWTVDADDPRLAPDKRDEARLTVFEWIVLQFVK